MGRSIALGTAEAEAQKSRKKCEGGGGRSVDPFFLFSEVVVVGNKGGNLTKKES